MNARMLMMTLVLINFVTAFSLQAEPKPSLTCKYFDSLMNSYEECLDVFPTKKVSVDPKGPYRELYKQAHLLLSKMELYKVEIGNGKGTFEFSAYAIDLNDDSVEEIILFPLIWRGDNTREDGSSLRGATGNGDIFIFQKKNVKQATKWKCIGEMGGLLLRFERRKTHGYRDIMIHIHASAMESIFVRYVYSPSIGAYKLIKERHLSCVAKSQLACYSPLTFEKHRLIDQINANKELAKNGDPAARQKVIDAEKRLNQLLQEMKQKFN